MKTVRELLQEADPIRYEPAESLDQHDFRRRALLAAVTETPSVAASGWRSRRVALTVVAGTAIAAILGGSRVWSVLVGDLNAAAIHFEARLADNKPGAGLSEVKLSESGRLIYLSDEVIVTNSDIASARAVQVGSTAEYNVAIEFHATWAQKMRLATENHIGKLLAILLDGKVVMAPVLRTSIAGSARITGNFTRAQAERIVNGIQIR